MPAVYQCGWYLFPWSISGTGDCCPPTFDRRSCFALGRGRESDKKVIGMPAGELDQKMLSEKPLKIPLFPMARGRGEIDQLLGISIEQLAKQVPFRHITGAL
jgi:hypothetical protein